MGRLTKQRYNRRLSPVPGLATPRSLAVGKGVKIAIERLLENESVLHSTLGGRVCKEPTNTI